MKKKKGNEKMNKRQIYMSDTHNYANEKERWDEIIEIWNEFMDLHMDYPFLRFMQIITMFQNWHQKVYATDGFYVEDDVLLKRFKKFLIYIGKGENH